jgi:hypothetical protein
VTDDPFAEINEQHAAHEAEFDRIRRSRDLLISVFLVGGIHAIATGAFWLFGKESAGDALMFGIQVTGAAFGMALGFKLAAAALLKEYAPFFYGFILTAVLAAATGFVYIVERWIRIDAWAIEIPAAWFLSMGWTAQRMYDTSFWRAGVLSLFGIGMALAIFLLFGSALAAITR